MQYPPGYSQLFTQRLNEVKNNFSYAWITFVSIRDAQISALVASQEPVSIDDVLALPMDQLMASAKADAGVPDRFMWFVIRGALITLYEAFKNDDERFAAAKDEDWFKLLASLRHSLSHGIEGEWRKIFPNAGDDLVFKRKLDGKTFTLNTSLIGAGIDATVFGGMPTAIDLFKTATDFAQSREPKP